MPEYHTPESFSATVDAALSPPKSAVPAKPVICEVGENDLVVIASDPQEMASAQAALVQNVWQKLEAAKRDLVEAKQILADTKMAKLDDTAAMRLLKREEQRVQYLEKVHAALAAGYVMVPNFDGNVIAIRVKRKHPQQDTIPRGSSWSPPRPSRELPDSLSAGDGRYVSPFPTGYTTDMTKTQDGKDKQDFVVTGFNEELALPAEFLKPRIIQRTGKAIEMRVFDEILCVVNADDRTNAWGRKGDPMVIGRIIEPGVGKKNQRRRVLSFMIAWFVDTTGI